MTTTSFRVEGADALVKRLSALPEKLQQAAGRNSARRAMAIVRDAAKDEVRQFDDPASKERIWKNVYVQQSRRQSKAVGGVVMRVGILGGAAQYGNTRANRRKDRVGKTFQTGGDKGNPGGDTWYWRFIELGTEKTGARPFLRPALEQNAGRVYETLRASLDSELDRLAKGQ